ncbi:type I DNA topoisomerase [bacterium]|jgi:DNA topoisomerase I|nr:type I DNA topoisomerase [bacterium]MBT6832037.1 type I DNA topoisomerase [bacterium]MBT6995818.1 type I DNA topoisomerase [bacterium]MBT7772371.1 type I DNA topoisomerase [bacterium]
MSKNLVIVESPAKAKTIEKFLGKDFTVKSSFGHIRDLPSKKMGLDIEGGTFEPTYEISDEKKKVVAELRKAAKGAEVWLAADEDREGEAIAWHLCAALKLDPKKTKRIVFHEITKPALAAAVKTPRVVNQPLVDAQQARRILDRLVGYELSPVLWRKVQTGLSAGRVQSVAVRIIVEREREIDAFDAVSTFKLVAEFDLGKGKKLVAKLPKNFPDEKTARAFLEKCIDAKYFVEKLETKPAKKSPAAPFTTSTLQQEASRKMGYGVKQTMMLAQRLYEAGKITYMRTDSVNLSDTALAAAAEEIEKDFGKEFVKVRKYKTKNADAQEAHEAIRPTHFNERAAGGETKEKKLYDLIWKRTIASQMAEAQIEKTVATVGISTTDEKLIAEGEVIKFPGFLEVYLEGTDDENGSGNGNKMLPPLETGEQLLMEIMTATESYNRARPRYTEASLVKKMEEEGIGRPSTYAPTISTIMARKYVEKRDDDGKDRELAMLTLQKQKITEGKKIERTGAERGKLFPTDLGEIVTDFLVKYFPNVVDYGFTRDVEADFDQIAQGKKEWQKMIGTFYKPFHKTIEAAGGISKAEASAVRELGIDPKTKKPIFAKMGRFGPMLQLGETESEEKPRFASLPAGASLKTITFEQSLKMFDLPRVVGKTPEGEEITANFGRFGPYIKIGKLFISIKPHDPLSITEKDALEMWEAKKKSEAEKYIQTFEKPDIQVLNGRYGAYITDGKKNAKIPKDKDPKKLTLKECEKLIKDAPAKTRRFVPRKK